jgi:hypothetical protein
VSNFVQNLWGRYRGEVLSAGIGAGVHAFVYFVLAPNNAYKFLVATLALMVWLQLASLFDVKRLFNKRLGILDDIVEAEFGFSLEDNQYNRRSRHFRTEKIKLADSLTAAVLPRLVQIAQRECPNVNKIHLFLDSGTTITPVFKPLFFRGLELDKDKKLLVHTNNLGGIDSLHKLPQVELERGRLTEENFHLLPGSPLSKYRATTGGGSHRFLTQLLEEDELAKKRKDSKSQDVVVISVITANWVLAGRGFDSLQICSRGRGHLEFKQLLVENSDYVVLVVPLPKILRLDDVKKLNDRVEKGQSFSVLPLPTEHKRATYLLTTHRPKHSLSPLLNVTIELTNLNGGKNYQLWPDCPEYDPPGNLKEVLASECPHQYVRDSFEEMYGLAQGI